MAEWIQVLLGFETLRDPRNIVMDPDPVYGEGVDAAVAKLLRALVGMGQLHLHNI